MRVMVLGGGLAGLSAAFHLSRLGDVEIQVLEAEGRVGGVCRSIQQAGFTYDYTGHMLHLKEAYTDELVQRLLGPELVVVDRRAQIYLDGHLTEYPFQINTYGLPPDVIKECLLGIIRAHYEPPDGEVRTFEDWILRQCGEGVAKYFMFPYNEKLWRVHPRQMTTDWMGRFVPHTSIDSALEGALKPPTRPVGYNAKFYYPEQGGIERLPLAFARSLPQGMLHTSEPVIGVDWRNRCVYTHKRQYRYDRLVTTIPLPRLVQLMREAPGDILEAAAGLRWVSVLGVVIGARGKQHMDVHWIYVPEPKYPFYRVGLPSNLTPSMTPPGCKSYLVEISYADWAPLPAGDIIARVVADLRAMEMLRSDDEIVHTDLVRIPYAYVIFDQERSPRTEVISSFLAEQEIISIGRYGGWEYASMESAILDGKRAADELVGAVTV